MTYVSHSILGMRNVSDKSCTENHNINFILNNPDRPQMAI